MAQGKGASNGVEWRVKVVECDGTSNSKALAPQEGLAVLKAWRGLKGLCSWSMSKVCRFLEKAWSLGVDDPRKVVHCLKVGMALTVVSLFYYMRPLYEGVGGNAMWAVMTVVVVFENTVGATISKSLNRIFGTILAGFLGVGVNWVAEQSGDAIQPLVVGASVFLLASAATFSRFIPSVKARFDYGAMIFILTFSLVSVSGYRVDELFALARDRISTIIIGTALCILVSMVVCPIWAGVELHNLIIRNMDKLSASLEGCVAEYFHDCDDNKNESVKNVGGYKCVLSSKATEDTMANLARWEPAHGRFSFRHPWKQYLNIGGSIRRCAYCVEALYSCVNSETQASELIKDHLATSCLRVSSKSSNVITELATSIKTMRRSSKIHSALGEMDNAVKDLQNRLVDLPELILLRLLPEVAPSESTERQRATTLTAATSLVDIVPLVTLASLLVEIAARVKGLADEVNELADLAEFKPAVDKESKCNRTSNRNASAPPQEQVNDDEGAMKALQSV